MPTGIYQRPEKHHKSPRGRIPWNKGKAKNPIKGLAYQGILRICETCGKSFITENRNIWRGGGRYCGKKCNPYFQSLKKYDDPKERYRVYYKKHLKQCHEKTRIRSAKRRQDPKIREKMNILTKEWKLKNPVKAKNAVREWVKNHPSEVRLLGLKRRANMKKAGGRLFLKDIKYLFANQRCCPYCGEPLSDKIEIDHIIPLYRGGNNKKENIILACRRCNRSKGHKLLSEWERTKNLSLNADALHALAWAREEFGG